MSELYKIFGLTIICSIIIAALSLLLMRLFKRHRLTIFIPSILFFIFSVILFIKGHFFSYPIEDFTYYLISVISLVTTLTVLIITVLIVKIKDNL